MKRFADLLRRQLLIMLLLFLTVSVTYAASSKVVIGTWIDPITWQQYQPQMQALQAALPAIEFEVQHITGDYTSKLLIMAVTGDLPDVVQLQPERAAPIVEANIVVDLTPYVEQDYAFNMRAWLPGAVDATKYRDIMFGVPSHVVNYTYAYNEQIFAERGIPFPNAAEWITWDQIRDIARKTTFDTSGDGITDVYGYYQGYDYDRILPLVFQSGGSVFDSNMEMTLTTPEVRESVAWLVDLIADGIHPPLGATPGDFDKGKFAANRLGSNRSIRVQDSGVSVGMTAGIQHHVKSEVAYVTTWAMTAQAKNQAGSWEFLKWMASAESQLYVAQRGRIPSRADVNMNRVTDPQIRAMLNGFIQSLMESRSYPYHLYSDVIQMTFSDDIKPALRQEAAVESTLVQIQNKINALIRSGGQ